MVETVVRDDGVHRVAVGDSGAVTAEAGEGDFQDLGGGEGLGLWGGDWEVVGGEERPEVFDLEEFKDGRDGGGVWELVVDE